MAIKGLDYSDIGRIVEDCKEYMASISYVSFRHIHREANDVANRLAHLASRSYIDDFWYEETPDLLLRMCSMRIFVSVPEVKALRPPRCTAQSLSINNSVSL